MAHRMEVELTSKSGDESWTWRAAGAKQPRGTVDAGLVPPDAAVGMVLRAEVEATLDGPVVIALMPPKTKSGIRAKGDLQRIEVTGTPRRGSDVNVVLASKGRRRDERTGGDGRRERSERGGRRERGERGDRAERGERGDRAERGERGDRSDRTERGDHRRGPGEERRDRRPAAAGAEGRDRRRGAGGAGAPREPRRSAPSTAYR
ncbi:MAG: hypothetical protein JO368_10725, partial [Acidimicrobiales bacterium]|nr:hypothetical protein [Acidimicrobiales bacterium]